MSKIRAPYPPEFRQQLVELLRAGRTPESLAREFEPSAQAIRNWLAQAAVPTMPLFAGQGRGTLQSATIPLTAIPTAFFWPTSLPGLPRIYPFPAINCLPDDTPNTYTHKMQVRPVPCYLRTTT